MSLGSALLRGMRPHQWTKNLFVFAPVVFARAIDKEGVVLRVVATFGIFCLISSGVYLMNDVFDRKADRLHPEKKNRPVASGELSAGTALVTALLLMAAGLFWARFGLESNSISAVCLVYVVIQALYTWHLKHMVIVDVLCIASGFVLRLLAGSFGAWAPLSEWIIVCTVFLSLFLALCKRRHEVTNLGEHAKEHRMTLASYPPALLDQLISAATAATLVTYALYTVDPRTMEAQGFRAAGREWPLLALTIPFAIYGLFRYLFLVYARNEGGSPTTTLLRDKLSLGNALLYVATVAAIFHFGSSV